MHGGAGTRSWGEGLGDGRRPAPGPAHSQLCPGRKRKVVAGGVLGLAFCLPGGRAALFTWGTPVECSLLRGTGTLQNI